MPIAIRQSDAARGAEDAFECGALHRTAVIGPAPF
jgi:hypothetical protein